MASLGGSDEIIFLGAGASVAAGVPATFGMVDAFRQTLPESERRPLDDVLRILNDWVKRHEGIEGKVDVELLLETLERLANLDQEVLARFLTLPESKSLDPVDMELLGAKLKNFIRKEGEVTSEKVLYLQPLFGLKKDAPLDIFSVNYDIAIEQLCNVNKKRYVDGFDFEWNSKNFSRVDVDVRLYKLHGSIMWYRTDTGGYVKIPISSQTSNTQLITGETAESLILYPMRKWEYEEPLQELLMELKDRLDTATMVIVAGYSFRDEHIRRVFWDSARRNRQFRLMLIGPHSLETYQKQLRFYERNRFVMGQSPDESPTLERVESELARRTICLPFEFEKVLPVLKNYFLPYVSTSVSLDNNRRNALSEGQDSTEYTIGELKYLLDCSHIEEFETVENQVSIEALFGKRPQEAIGICLRALLTYAGYGNSSQCNRWLQFLGHVLHSVRSKLEDTKFTFWLVSSDVQWFPLGDALRMNLDVLRRARVIRTIMADERLESATPIFDFISKLELQLTMLAGIRDTYSYRLLRGKGSRNEIRRFARATQRYTGSKTSRDATKAEDIASKIEQDEFYKLIRQASK